MLRILVSALQVGPRQTGVGIYALELIRAMTHLPRDHVEIVVAAPYPEAFDFLADVEGFQVVPVRLLGDSPWGRMLAIHANVPRIAHEMGADVVLGPNFIAPLWGRFRTAVVVHDLTFRRFPETMPPAKRVYFQIVVRRSVRRASRVFVTTQTMADEVLDFDPSVRGKLRIISGGVSAAYLENGDRERKEAPLPARRERRDFLFVGTLEPRKNLERLLAVHGNLCRFDPSFPALRVVGGRGWEDDGIRRAVRAHPDPSRLHLLGYTSPAGLRREYDSALALVFPSLYEGFGLPAVEAMTRGCPVLTSRGIATAEVTGGAAILVDPLDSGDLERGLRRLVEDSELRRRLSAEGTRRAREFSMERSARATLDGLRDLVPAPGQA